MTRGFVPIVGALSAIGLALGSMAWFGDAPSPDPPGPAVASVPMSVPIDSGPVALVTVHVSGAVALPGLVRLPTGARVADAIAAAGGVLPNGAVDAVNLAGRVADGQHLVVPVRSRQGIVTVETGDGLVHVNTASAEELATLPGVGPVIAQRIVEHRQARGPFATLEDLLDVPGIGEAKLAALRDVAAP